MTQSREARNIRPNGARHGSPPSKKSSYKLSGTRSSRPITSTRTFQEPPTAGPIVLDEAVATEDGVDVPQHLGCSPVPACPHRKSHPVTRSGRQPGPYCEDDTSTATHLKTYLKEWPQPTKRVYPKESIFWTKIIRTASQLYT